MQIDPQNKGDLGFTVPPGLAAACENLASGCPSKGGPTQESEPSSRKRSVADAHLDDPTPTTTPPPPPGPQEGKKEQRELPLGGLLPGPAAGKNFDLEVQSPGTTPALPVRSNYFPVASEPPPKVFAGCTKITVDKNFGPKFYHYFSL